MLKFPNGRNDDFVDTIAWIGMGLDRFATPGGLVSKREEMPEVGTFGWVKWQSKQDYKQEQLIRLTEGF